MSPTLQTLMLHDTGGAGLTRAHSRSTLGHSGGGGPGGSSGPNGQPVGAVGGGGAPVEFDPDQMEGEYTLVLERPWDAWVRGSMVHIHVRVRACVRLCMCMCMCSACACACMCMCSHQREHICAVCVPPSRRMTSWIYSPGSYMLLAPAGAGDGACICICICICIHHIHQVGRRLVQEGTQRWTGVKMDGTPTTKHKKWSEPEHLPAK